MSTKILSRMILMPDNSIAFVLLVELYLHNKVMSISSFDL